MSAGPPDGAAFVLDWSNRCPESPLADPGGPITPERIAILRHRAAYWGNRSPMFTSIPTMAEPLCDALDEVERLHAALDAQAGDMAMLLRMLGEHGHRNIPGWLTRRIEEGHADALQADRADVLGTANLGGRPVVHTVGPSPWYRHSVPPQGHGLASYLGALRVRDMLLGRP